MKIKLLLPLLLIFIISCYTRYSNHEFNEDFSLNDSTVTVAVMNFEYSGSFISSKQANLIADLITSELYIEKNVNVIDRSMIKNLLRKYENSKSGRFSREEIQAIGAELKSSYIALGSINSVDTIEDYYETGLRRISITMRLLDSKTGDVVGILRQQKGGEDNIDDLIKIAVREMIKTI